MDARIDESAAPNIRVLTVSETQPTPGYHFNTAAFNAIIDFAKQNNPRFKGLSDVHFAEICNVSATTFKLLRKSKDPAPRVDTLYSILAPLGASIDRVVYLAPVRDIEREQAQWDGTLVDGLQQQVAHLTRQKAADDTEIKDLRQSVILAEKAASRAEAHAEALTNTIAALNADALRHRREIRRHRIATLIIVLLLIALCAFIVWEIANPNRGIFVLR